MKRLFLLCLIHIVVVHPLFSQDLNDLEKFESIKTIYQVCIGANTINNLGLRSPLNSPGDWAFSRPISFGIEARSYLNRDLAFAVDAGLNKIDEHTYYSLDGNIKYYFNNWIPLEKFEFFANGGLGLFNVDKTNVSTNVGGGVLYWINKKFGVRLRSMAKFAFNANDNLRTNNHFQHNLELVLVL